MFNWIIKRKLEKIRKHEYMYNVDLGVQFNVANALAHKDYEGLKLLKWMREYGIY